MEKWTKMNANIRKDTSKLYFSLIILVVWLVAAVVPVVAKLGKYENIAKYVPIFLSLYHNTGDDNSSCCLYHSK